MSMTAKHSWEAMRTSESRQVEASLGQHFQSVDAYRYNAASLRIRVLDPRFEGLSRIGRDAMVEPYLDQLPAETQQDIVFLITFAPSELSRPPATFQEFMRNVELEDPAPSML